MKEIDVREDERMGRLCKLWGRALTDQGWMCGWMKNVYKIDEKLD